MPLISVNVVNVTGLKINYLYPVCVFTFFFVKDFSGTTTPRILKFCTNISYGMLYCVRENHYPHAYYSLYLSIFSFSSIKFFVTDFSSTTAPRIVKYCTNFGYGLLYHVRENPHRHAHSDMTYSRFFFIR